ncbi:MAG: hypothetical protein VYA51_08050 [Planctomycetota bacterium]|nr:hypothetical protein [Planctomycetota bacterium]MEC9047951.1 hypothetical protein [Planctomycetota bacterium]
MEEPARIGIVDMGSNAIRFLIAEGCSDEHRVLETHRQPVRLGDAVFRTGDVPDSAIADTVAAFEQFRDRCDQLGVGRRRAVATSAMRNARNRARVLDRVLEASGFAIEVISGVEEARLLMLGIEREVDLSAGRSVLLDVGGGSAEVVIIDEGDLVSATSYPLGALRMLQQFREEDGARLASRVTEHLKLHDRQITDLLGDAPAARFVAAGGNIQSLFELVRLRSGTLRVDSVDACAIEDLGEEVRRVASMSVTERMARHGLRADRADTIVPAGVVYHHLGRLVGAEHVLAPRAGVKEGLLAATLQPDHER